MTVYLRVGGATELKTIFKKYLGTNEKPNTFDNFGTNYKMNCLLRGLNFRPLVHKTSVRILEELLE
jgi:hypothetical protein